MKQVSEELNDQMKTRLEKLRGLEEKGVSGFGNKFERTHLTNQLKEAFDHFTKEELAEKEEETEVTIAGRIMTKRGKGKQALPISKTWMDKFSYMYEKMKSGKKHTNFSNPLT